MKTWFILIIAAAVGLGIWFWQKQKKKETIAGATIADPAKSSLLSDVPAQTAAEQGLFSKEVPGTAKILADDTRVAQFQLYPGTTPVLLHTGFNELLESVTSYEAVTGIPLEKRQAIVEAAIASGQYGEFTWSSQDARIANEIYAPAQAELYYKSIAQYEATEKDTVQGGTYDSYAKAVAESFAAATIQPEDYPDYASYREALDAKSEDIFESGEIDSLLPTGAQYGTFPAE